MREIAEIELAIQGGTEKIETLGTKTALDPSPFIHVSSQVNKAKSMNPCVRWLPSRR